MQNNSAFATAFFAGLGVSAAQAQPANSASTMVTSTGSHACPDSSWNAGRERISDRSSCEAFLWNRSSRLGQFEVEGRAPDGRSVTTAKRRTAPICANPSR